MKDKNTDLITMVENKIHHVVYNLPIIVLCGGKNKCNKYRIDCEIQPDYDSLDKIKNEIKKNGYHDFDKLLSRAKSEKYRFLHSLKWIKINNLDELSKTYDEYLMDDQIYDYALSLIFNKYNLYNKKYTFKLPCGKINIKKTDTGTQMMDKLGYFNLMKHKYYTLSFLNKNFIKIKKDDVDNGYYDDYINSENMYTKHVVLKCAELA